MCTRMHAHAHIHTREHMHACMHAHTHTRTDTHTQHNPHNRHAHTQGIHPHTHTHARTHTRTHTHTHMWVLMYICTHAKIHLFAHSSMPLNSILFMPFSLLYGFSTTYILLHFLCRGQTINPSDWWNFLLYVKPFLDKAVLLVTRKQIVIIHLSLLSACTCQWIFLL